jgi:hypothetical protein
METEDIFYSPVIARNDCALWYHLAVLECLDVNTLKERPTLTLAYVSKGFGYSMC